MKMVIRVLPGGHAIFLGVVTLKANLLVSSLVHAGLLQPFEFLHTPSNGW